MIYTIEVLNVDAGFITKCAVLAETFEEAQAKLHDAIGRKLVTLDPLTDDVIVLDEDR